MHRLIAPIAAAWALTLLAHGSALADGGVALVIGNAAYSNAKALPTVAADADATAETLKGAGYDVTTLHDVKQAEIGQAMRDFLTKVQTSGGDAVAFLYFSGYAMQFNGEDYLVPADAAIGKNADVPSEALRLGDVTDELAKLQTKATIVVLDGSRADGFAPSGDPQPTPGLAFLPAPSGMLIAYAAQPGAVAPDGEGQYSLFAGALNTAMRQPGRTFEDIFKATRLQVAEATANAQVPWTASALSGDARLFEPAAAEAAPAPGAEAGEPPAAAPATTAEAAPAPAELGVAVAPPPPPIAPAEMPAVGAEQAYRSAVATDSLAGYQGFVQAYPRDDRTPQMWVLIQSRREAILWQRALAVDSPRGYWNYLRRFPDGPHAFEARQRLDALQAATAPPPDYTPAPIDLPVGYTDEGFGLAEIVPVGDPPPPVVFEPVDPVYLPPPDYLPPPPPGFFAPPVIPFLPALLPPTQVVIKNITITKIIKITQLPPPPKKKIAVIDPTKPKPPVIPNPVKVKPTPPTFVKPPLKPIAGQKPPKVGLTLPPNGAKLVPPTTTIASPTPVAAQPPKGKVSLPPANPAGAIGKAGAGAVVPAAKTGLGTAPIKPLNAIKPAPTPLATPPKPIVAPTPSGPVKATLPPLPGAGKLAPVAKPPGTPQPGSPPANAGVVKLPATPTTAVPLKPAPAPITAVPLKPAPAPTTAVPLKPAVSNPALDAQRAAQAARLQEAQKRAAEAAAQKRAADQAAKLNAAQQAQKRAAAIAAQKAAAEQAAKLRAAQDAQKRNAAIGAQKAAAQAAAQRAAAANTQRLAAQRAAQQAAAQRAAQAAAQHAAAANAQRLAAQRAAQQAAAQHAAQAAAQRAAQQAAAQRAAQAAAQRAAAERARQQRCVIKDGKRVCP